MSIMSKSLFFNLNLKWRHKVFDAVYMVQFKTITITGTRGLFDKKNVSVE